MIKNKLRSKQSKNRKKEKKSLPLSKPDLGVSMVKKWSFASN